ncbi:hypothetical protein [Absidia glauca]|uniref:Zn(2)-C6 fungal-type domain-containing protein n=1 Tax=Absidia glauca TaxID=4829 RepID=A0A168MXR8_ABSGL|nr:hypothetical protein [Absidia glauca]
MTNKPPNLIPPLACVFCRRSHMTCDEGRPCQRCIKRSIGDMCHDTPTGRKKTTTNNSPPEDPTTTPLPTPPSTLIDDMDENNWVTTTFTSGSIDNELNVLNDFVEDHQPSRKESTRDNFFLTAADPKDGKLEDRLNEVINAKYEAGFLKPYNYVNGYARLQRYMDKYMSPDSRQRILNVMGTFRPAFRDVAQSLTDVDLILVEEAFERLLLDYDRVFSAMAIPACLWRRTGEIYKGNKEFATLIDVSVDDLRDGRLCIYEIMAEESTVNYWEVSIGNRLEWATGFMMALMFCFVEIRQYRLRCSTKGRPYLLFNSAPNETDGNVLLFLFYCPAGQVQYTIIVGNFLPIEIQN